jgi:hypothetical protein
MIIIKNINPAFGDSVTFEPEATLTEALAVMARSISACGPEFQVQPEDLIEGRDFEILAEGVTE